MLKKWKNPGLDLMTHKGALGLHMLPGSALSSREYLYTNILAKFTRKRSCTKGMRQNIVIEPWSKCA